MFTKRFWKDAVERAISTAAQFGLVVGGLDTVSDDLEVSLGTVATAMVLGALSSILKSLAASQIGNSESASFVSDVAP